MGGLFSKLKRGNTCEEEFCTRPLNESPELKGIDSVDLQQHITYSKRPGTSGMSGQLYEIQLLMYFLLQGKKLCEENKMKDFLLATNMQEAGDLDDVVFRYHYIDQTGAEKRKVIFLQAKHRENPQKDKVSLDKLLSGENKGDFNLKTYFTAYRKIKECFQKLKTPPIFGSEFEDCELVLFTNSTSTFSESDKNVESYKVDEKDIPCTGESKDTYFYKLNLHESYDQKIRETLEGSSDCKKLAKQLAEFVISRKCVNVDTGVMKLYHCNLAEEVIERTEGKEGKFREDFLVSENHSNFKQMFLDEIQSREEFSGFSEGDLIAELATINIILPGNFGSVKDKDKKPALPNDVVYEDEIVDFLSRFKIFVNQPNEKRLSEMIKKEIQEKFAVEDSDIESVFSEIRSKIQNWWKDDNYFLTQDNKFYEESARVSVWFEVKDPVELFTGRQEELLKLHETLQRNQGDDKMTVISQSTSISGLGGIGKSELARKYIQLYSKEYEDNIVWLNAENYVTLCGTFRRLARSKLRICTEEIDGKPRDIQCIVKEVFQFFSKRRSLFVFDNAEKCRSERDGGDGIGQFMTSLPPSANKPYILITSRNRNWGNIEVLSLSTFREEEAEEFISKALAITEESEGTEVKTLAETLQYFPLALQQAVSYIRETNSKLQIMGSKFSIRDYIERYKQETEKLLNHNFPDDSLDLYTKTTFTTWRITISKIEDVQHGKQAIMVLRIIAYLSAKNIPVEIFRRNEQTVAEDERLANILHILKQYSMIEATEGVVNIHKLVQEVTQINIRRERKELFILSKVFELLKRNVKYCNDTVDGAARMRRLLPHLESFISNIDCMICRDGEDKGNCERMYVECLVTEMGHMYEITGNPRRQEELLLRALTIQLKYLKPENLRVASTLFSLSNAYMYLRDPVTQKKLLVKVLPILEKHYGSNNINVARCLLNLSTAYGALGQPLEQKKLLERALQLKEKHFGFDHFEVARCLQNLSNVYSDLGEPLQQKRLLERALLIEQQHFGADHFEVAKCLVSLGNAYGALGEPLERKKLLERALEILEKHYGNDNFQVAVCLENLGMTYGNLGQPLKQKELLEKVLEIKEKHYGTDHFEVAKCLGNLGIAYGALGEPLKQKILLEKALQTLERYYGPDHFEVAIGLVHLGEVYRDVGEPMEQKKLLERALQIKVKHYGADHIEVARCLSNLGNAYGGLGDHLEQKKLFERELQILEKRYGPHHWDVARCLVNLGNAYGALGETLEQKKLLERALQIKEQHFGADHFEVAVCLGNLGNTYGALGEHLKKKKLLERALRIEEAHYGSDHYEVAITLENLGNAYGALGEPLEQRKLHERALHIRKKNEGHHFQVVVF